MITIPENFKTNVKIYSTTTTENEIGVTTKVDSLYVETKASVFDLSYIEIANSDGTYKKDDKKVYFDDPNVNFDLNATMEISGSKYRIIDQRGYSNVNPIANWKIAIVRLVKPTVI